MRANTSQRIEPNTIDSGTARVTLTTRVLYRIGVLLNTFIATIFYRIQVEGREHFPEHGGVLVIANHQSYYDPPIIGSMLNTRIFAFLARAGLFKIPGFGWLISALNAKPLSGDGNETRAMREMLRLLEDGWPILVFPEGARTKDGGMVEFQRGILLLLKRANCPIVPVAIEGFYDTWPKHKKLPRFFGCRMAMRVSAPMTYEQLLEQSGGDALAWLHDHINQMRTELRSQLLRTTKGRFPATVQRSIVG
ncbi:MAG: 1-acyl-sn-glycerol-3-phosphate acyltransferase [Phycisphaeraceae bacterium]|nr:1-acyl-sn-glycerol-3-phosphate acyltransferase [Phycisphaerales bacterium]MCB9861344.1 1-acyl-sn-glycerol-3-phosphate acyltransferase [Phycisphaeraceae bacterium]